MNNNEWITDRRPLRDDGPYVYTGYGAVRYYTEIPRGEIWKPIPKCEPYVKPKRYTVKMCNSGWAVYDTVTQDYFADHILTLGTAERIAAIYEEVMP